MSRTTGISRSSVQLGTSMSTSNQDTPGWTLTTLENGSVTTSRCTSTADKPDTKNENVSNIMSKSTYTADKLNSKGENGLNATSRSTSNADKPNSEGENGSNTTSIPTSNADKPNSKGENVSNIMSKSTSSADKPSSKEEYGLNTTSTSTSNANKPNYKGENGSNTTSRSTFSADKPISSGETDTPTTSKSSSTADKPNSTGENGSSTTSRVNDKLNSEGENGSSTTPRSTPSANRQNSKDESRSTSSADKPNSKGENVPSRHTASISTSSADKPNSTGDSRYISSADKQNSKGENGSSRSSMSRTTSSADKPISNGETDTPTTSKSSSTAADKPDSKGENSTSTMFRSISSPDKTKSKQKNGHSTNSRPTFNPDKFKCKNISSASSSPGMPMPEKRPFRLIRPKPVYAWEYAMPGHTGNWLNLTTGHNNPQTLPIYLSNGFLKDATTSSSGQESDLGSIKQFLLSAGNTVEAQRRKNLYLSSNCDRNQMEHSLKSSTAVPASSDRLTDINERLKAEYWLAPGTSQDWLDFNTGWNTANLGDEYRKNLALLLQGGRLVQQHSLIPTTSNTLPEAFNKHINIRNRPNAERYFSNSSDQTTTVFNLPCLSSFPEDATFPQIYWPAFSVPKPSSAAIQNLTLQRGNQLDIGQDKNISLNASRVISHRINKSHNHRKTNKTHIRRFFREGPMRLPIKLPPEANEHSSGSESNNAKSDLDKQCSVHETEEQIASSQKTSGPAPSLLQSILSSVEDTHSSEQPVPSSVINPCNTGPSNCRNNLLNDENRVEKQMSKQVASTHGQKRPYGAVSLDTATQEASLTTSKVIRISTTDITPTQAIPCASFPKTSKTIPCSLVLNAYPCQGKQQFMTIYTYTEDSKQLPTQEKENPSQQHANATLTTKIGKTGRKDTNESDRRKNRAHPPIPISLLKGHALGCKMQLFNLEIYKCREAGKSVQSLIKNKRPRIECECTPCDICGVAFKSKYRVFTHKMRGCTRKSV